MRLRRWAAMVAALLLCVSMTGCARTSIVPQGLTIYMLPVGEADCFLLRQGTYTMLIDAGEAASADAIVSFIASLGIDRLDCVLLTHPHADHIGGMSRVLKAFDIGLYLYGEVPLSLYSPTMVHRRVDEVIDEKSINTMTWTEGLTLPLGEATVRIYPLLGQYDDANEYSAICRVEYQGRSAVFTGDSGEAAQSKLLAKGTPLQADVLKLSHHGGPDAAYEAFLKAVSPSVGLISCGEGSDGQHPSKKTLTLAARYGVAVYRADLHGAVKVELTKEAIRIETERG